MKTKRILDPDIPRPQIRLVCTGSPDAPHRRTFVVSFYELWGAGQWVEYGALTGRSKATKRDHVKYPTVEREKHKFTYTCSTCRAELRIAVGKWPAFARVLSSASASVDSAADAKLVSLQSAIASFRATLKQ